MVEVRWTLQASDDLDSIVSFISKDSEHYARLFVVDIFEALEQIASFPESGRVVPEMDDASIREIILGSYRLVYKLGKKHADLLTIYHGARLFDPKRIS